MSIIGLDRMSIDALRSASLAIAAQWDEALRDYKAEANKMPSRMTAAQRERMAYLRGVISGAAAATHAIERRASLEIVET